MVSSLDRLVANLPKEAFKNFGIPYEGEQLELLSRKGIFRYDWFDGFNKLSETNLPPRGEFYSKLHEEGITEDNYQHARRVWDTFETKTMRDYRNLFLETDVLLLADVFENFRDVCCKNY